MKKLLYVVLIVISIASILNCFKDNEIEDLIKETEDKNPVRLTNRVTTEVTTKVTTPATTWPQYDDGSYVWEIEFKIYTNIHHPNGYVIFQKISKWLVDEEKATWTIDYNASNYIEEIHYNLKAKHRNGGYEENNVFLPSNKDFRDAFRTCEAIYLGWINNDKISPVPMELVKAAAARMEGRSVGLANN